MTHTLGFSSRLYFANPDRGTYRERFLDSIPLFLVGLDRQLARIVYSRKQLPDSILRWSPGWPSEWQFLDFGWAWAGLRGF
jgi:hypothetical protein